jgi:hypothetical protein
MSRIARFGVLVAALMSLFAVLSSSAGATQWHNAGGTNFTGTAGVGTLSVTGVNLSCTGADATGDAPAFSSALTYAATGTATFTGCKISGIPHSVTCSYSLTVTNAAVNHVFTGSADATCDVRDTSGFKVCHIEGSTPGTYRNAETGLTAQLVLTTSTTLRTTNGDATHNCPLGAGEPAHLTPQTFNVTSSPAPTIVRTVA